MASQLAVPTRTLSPTVILSNVPVLILTILFVVSPVVFTWETEAQPKIIGRFGDVQQHARFLGNESIGEYFSVLEQDDGSILIGARNAVYNISVYDLTENKEQRIEWVSTAAHRELCSLKGKSETECQNYVRIVSRTDDGQLMVCGTNSFKPLCRMYSPKTDNVGYAQQKEFEGQGLCPYDPDHNSTNVYVDGQLYSATVADFSGGDPLVYRRPQRTERSDLKQLNQPAFVGSMGYGDHVMFFFRETAVEYMNCGKAVYSRVARVCKNDKGGPHQFGDRWTSFLKARLNCSVPGEYPFYFDEIQSVSTVVDGIYSGKGQQLVYGVFTTPQNAIGGSAICAFNMKDVLRVFKGPFKDQPSINANWLPVPADKVPDPRPGTCVADSRTLPDTAVNFVKTHTLMEDTVSAFFSQPVLTRVSLQYRFTVIAVDPQVRAMNGKTYDVLYIGTDDGRVIKALNTLSPESLNNTLPAVISELQVLPPGKPITGLRVAPAARMLIVIGRDQIVNIPLHHCQNLSCQECVSLQDPHCAFDNMHHTCTALHDHPYPSVDRFQQDILKGDPKTCQSGSWAGLRPKTPSPNHIRPAAAPTHGTVIGVGSTTELDNEIVIQLVDSNALAEAAPKETEAAPSQPDPMVIYTAQTMQTVVLASCLGTLAAGFVGGFLFSRRMKNHGPYSEQHNHLHRHIDSNLTAQCSQYVAPPNNKNSNIPSNINLLKNVGTNKQDNLQHELSKHSECKNSTESLDNMGTLQKVKKTYI